MEALTEEERKREPEPNPDAGKEKANRRAGNFEIFIYEAWCKRCGTCAEFCPKEVLACDDLRRPRVIHEEGCIGCLLCVYRCPDFAIAVSEKTSDLEE